MSKAHCTAVVLAAGRGKRMGTKVHKQYLEVAGRPVLYYALQAFEESEVIDDIILVTGAGEEEYCQKEIVDRYGITKVSHILQGGKERYNSVWNGLQCIQEEGYVFIHDGARPFVDKEIIERVFKEVQVNKACVVGMPVKDTIKMVDDKGFVETTPDRSRVWLVQTPQVFENKLVKEAYARLMAADCTNVTDDAMVVEQMMDYPVKLVQGSYENIKITTPEDLEIAEIFVNHKKI